MKSKNPKNKKNYTRRQSRSNYFEKQNDKSNDLLKLIQHKLKFSANNVHKSSLWQVGCSVKYWLERYQEFRYKVKPDEKTKAEIERLTLKLEGLPEQWGFFPW